MLSEQALASDQVFTSQEGVVPALIKITGSKITSVETCSKEEYSKKLKIWQRQCPGLRDYSGYAVSPGFINAHTHIAMNLFRGIDCESSTRGNMIEDLFYHTESRLSRDDVLAFSKAGALENLLNGNLLVWDHYYHGDAVAGALLETGLTGVIAPTLQDVRGPGRHSSGAAWDHTLAIHHSEKLKAQGIYAAFGPHATDTVSEKLWLSILDAAKKYGLPVHSHHAQSSEEYSRSMQENGCSPGEWLHRLGVFGNGIHHTLVHNIYTRDQDFKYYTSPGITFISCPFSALVFAFPALVTEWERQGIRWSLGTDCVASNDSMNLQKEMRYTAGVPVQQVSFAEAYREFRQANEADTAGLQSERTNAWEAFSSFRNPAWLLDKVWNIPGKMHPGVTAGVIAEHALANLLVWDTSHPAMWPFAGYKNLAMGDTTQAIHNAMAAGNWLGKDGSYHKSLLERLNYRDIQLEAGQRFRSLLTRCGL